MITLEAAGGLGNRMRAIASFVQLLREENLLDQLEILWYRRPNLNCPFELLFEPLEKVNVKSVWQGPFQPWRKLVRFMKKCRSDYYFEDRDLIRLQGIPKELFPDFNGKKVYIATCQALCDNPDFSIFRPCQKIEEQVNLLIPENKNIIGIHIRRGDHKLARAASTTEKFLQVMSYEINKDPKVSFFLATDSKEEEKCLKNKFQNRIIVQKQKNFTRNADAGIVAALIDMLALARTKNIYGSFNSSFSEIAASIGKIPLTVIQ